MLPGMSTLGLFLSKIKQNKAISKQGGEEKAMAVLLLIFFRGSWASRVSYSLGCTSRQLSGIIWANDGVNSSEQMTVWVYDDETGSPAGGARTGLCTFASSEHPPGSLNRQWW